MITVTINITETDHNIVTEVCGIGHGTKVEVGMAEHLCTVLKEHLPRYDAAKFHSMIEIRKDTLS